MKRNTDGFLSLQLLLTKFGQNLLHSFFLVFFVENVNTPGLMTMDINTQSNKMSN